METSGRLGSLLGKIYFCNFYLQNIMVKSDIFEMVILVIFVKSVFLLSLFVEDWSELLCVGRGLKWTLVCWILCVPLFQKSNCEHCTICVVPAKGVNKIFVKQLFVSLQSPSAAQVEVLLALCCNLKHRLLPEQPHWPYRPLVPYKPLLS